MPATPAKPDLLSRLLDRRDAWRRRILRHRGALAALLAALAVYLVIHSVTAPAPPTEPVWVAAHDLHSGTTLSRDDFVRREYAAGTAPRRIVTDPTRVAGRVLAIPVGSGMPVGRDAVMGSRWLTGYPGLSAVPVRITDAAVAPLLEVGSRVDLVASDPQRADSAHTVVRRAAILALPAPVSDDSSPLGGRLVVVGVPAEDVEAVATAGARSYVTVVWPAPIGGS
jgi:Flp pilus assembly protein CpaB